MNLYAYCAGNPVNHIDPDGLDPTGRNVKGRIIDQDYIAEPLFQGRGEKVLRLNYEGADWIPIGLNPSSHNQSKLYLNFTVETHGMNWFDSTSIQVKNANVVLSEMSSAYPSLDHLTKMRSQGVKFRGSQKKSFVVEFRIDGGSPPQGTLIEGYVDINISNPTGRGTVRWEASPTVYHPKHPDGGGGFTPFTRDLKQNDFKYEWP